VLGSCLIHYHIRSENALLEAPTGTGKTLALLCAALQWQLDFKNNPDLGATQTNSIKHEGDTSNQSTFPNIEIKEKCGMNQTPELKVEVTKVNIKPDPQPSAINVENNNVTHDKTNDINRVVLDLTDLDDDFKPAKRLFTFPTNKKRSLNNTGDILNDGGNSTKKRKVDREPEIKSKIKEENSSKKGKNKVPKRKSTRDGDSDHEGSQTPGLRAPRIYYASRTHAQVKKVVAELRKTPYHPKMAVIGSRDHTCVHPTISLSRTRDADW